MFANRQLNRFVFVALLGLTLLGVWAAGSPVSQARAAAMDIESWRSDNGARVMYVHAPELPMVDIRVVFAAGSARDGDKPGVASLTNTLLNHGAGRWDTDAIAERFDDVGASYGASSERDMAIVTLRALTDEHILEQAMDTFSTVLTSPNFPEAEFERERARTLVAIQDQKQSPSDMASLNFYEHLYGDHPYASPTIGTEQSVKALSVKDVQAFYQRYYVGNNAVVAIVGAVSREQAEEMAERSVGRLPAGKAAPELPPVEPLKESQRVHEVFSSAQTHILVGQPGMARGAEDYFALYVGNHVLGGGGFGSRIFEEIREKRGLAYSAYSYFIPMSRKGPFQMGLQTKNSQAEKALTLLKETLTEFIDNGPTEEELTHSKKNITGSFPLRIDSNRNMVEYAAMIGFYDLPLDYLETFNDKVEQVSREDVQSAFKKHIDPDALLTVLVGPGDNGETTARK